MIEASIKTLCLEAGVGILKPSQDPPQAARKFARSFCFLFCSCQEITLCVLLLPGGLSSSGLVACKGVQKYSDHKIELQLSAVDCSTFRLSAFLL